MKRIITLGISLCLTVLCFGQQAPEYGNGFDFKYEEEQEPKLVLTDSYNAYLLTYINTNGILSKREIIIRKFDQKNQLVDTYKKTFPEIDNGTLYNYIGSAAMPGNNKVVIFTESYTGKSDKQDLYRHIFDKATGSFTTSLVKSFPMESVNKKGVFQFELSENNRFIGIVNVKNSTKKEVVQNTVMMLDVANAGLLWSKDIPLEAKDYERSFTVTNSGKAVFVRAAKGMKLYNYLTVVTEAAAENKELGEEVQLQDPKAISIGNRDYLLAFDHNAKGLRSGDFEKFMLYDLDAAKIMNNNKISIFNNLKDVKEVEIRNVFIQNNEFHIFAEARVKAGTRPVKVNQFSTMAFDEPYYRYGPAYMIIMDYEGKIKNIAALGVNQNNLAEIYPSFGVVNVKGDYRIIGSGSEIYKWSPNGNFSVNPKESVRFRTYDNTLENALWWDWQPVPHLFGYLPDSKKFIIGRYYNKQLSLITVPNP
ncbi:MAG: hypothetical protein WKF88_05540 [Ferruginibacter sp.]